MKNFKNSDLGDNYTQIHNTATARWEKLQADGKWHWIFKRGATWLTLILFIYGLGAMLLPTQFDFQPTQFYILLGMFGAFLVSSNFEWAKMERTRQDQNKIK